MNTDFSKLKIGTRVWDYCYGWGEMVEVNFRDKPCIITVRFKTNTRPNYETYTSYGRWDPNHINPRLFIDEFEIPDSAFRKKVKSRRINEDKFE